MRKSVGPMLCLALSFFRQGYDAGGIARVSAPDCCGANGRHIAVGQCCDFR